MGVFAANCHPFSMGKEREKEGRKDLNGCLEDEVTTDVKNGCGRTIKSSLSSRKKMEKRLLLNKVNTVRLIFLDFFFFFF